MTKNELRKEGKKLRDSLSAECAATYSRKIMEKLSELPEYGAAHTVCCYLSFGKEVDTKALIETMLCQGKAVCLPRVTGEHDMVALEVSDLAELETSRYGIGEPVLGRHPEIKAQDVDLFLVPAVCFHRTSGHRVGYGKGYYDRFLSNSRKNAAKVGLAFELQLTDFSDTDEHDVPMDAIVTERRVYRMEEQNGRE